MLRPPLYTAWPLTMIGGSHDLPGSTCRMGHGRQHVAEREPVGGMTYESQHTQAAGDEHGKQVERANVCVCVLRVCLWCGHAHAHTQFLNSLQWGRLHHQRCTRRLLAAPCATCRVPCFRSPSTRRRGGDNARSNPVLANIHQSEKQYQQLTNKLL